MKQENNPCRHLKVAHQESGLRQALITTLANGVGRSEEQTKRLFNL